jgi:endoplasmic reticulum Man9GlcNAc2 1,2-alpha-mannosidase
MNKKHFKTGWKRIPRDEKGNLVRDKMDTEIKADSTSAEIKDR